jgi:hypothetical protein
MSVENSSKPLEEQLLFKLGSLEGTVVSGMRRIDEQLTVLVDNFVKHQQESNNSVSALEIRVNQLEKWQEGAKIRTTTLVMAVTAVWAVFSGKVQALANSFLG